MGPHMIQGLLKAHPFRPFQIVTEGCTYEVNDPSHIKILMTRLLVPYGFDDSGFAEDFHIVPYESIQSIRFINS